MKWATKKPAFDDISDMAPGATTLPKDPAPERRGSDTLANDVKPMAPANRDHDRALSPRQQHKNSNFTPAREGKLANLLQPNLP